MHYCIHLFTKELPNEAQIEDILRPFNSETVFGDDENAPKEYPAFTWDYFRIGGRYGGQLQLRIDAEDDEYKWKFYAKEGEQREGRLFHSRLLKKIREKFVSYDSREEYWIAYMGDGSFIFVDGAKIEDILNTSELGCFGFVDIDGTAYSRERWLGSGKGFDKYDDFDERYQQTLKERSDCFLTVLDIHD